MSEKLENQPGIPDSGMGDGPPIDPDGMVAEATKSDLGGVIVDIMQLPDAERRAYAEEQGIDYKEMMELLND